MCSIKKKIIASLLITIIVMTNLTIIGKGAGISYADNSNLEKQSIVTNNENVEFDAYFISKENKTHTLTQEITKQDTLYLDIKVKNTGYLKNASVEANSNFKIGEDVQQEQIQKIENNKIQLNQINGNTEKYTIALPIYFDANKKVNINEFSKQNDIKLKATYMDDEGKEHKIEKTINNMVTWVANPKVEINQNIQKYNSYEIENEKGIIIEQKLTVGIQNNALPIAESNIEIQVPKIENKTPQINVRKQNELQILSQDNWNYNSNNGKLIIKQSNIPDSEGKVEWDSQEEYIITYRYENIEEQKEIDFNSNISANVKTYGGEIKTLNETYSQENKLSEKIGNIIEEKQSISKENISKGYLYTNLEIPYEVKYDIDIAYSKVADEIVLTANQAKWNTQKEQIGAGSYFKQLKVNTQNFNDILGKEGYISVLSNNKEIARITSNEEENIVVDIQSSNINEITIKTSKPQKEGMLEIIAEKTIKEENITKAQIEKIEKLEETSSIQVNKNNTEIIKDNQDTTIETVEPTSKMKIEMSNTQFSTVLESQEVEIKATLKTNSEYDSLYKDPTIDITLPKEMENVQILGTELLYEDELKIENVQVINAENKTIRVTLEGTQTKYAINEVAEGATIVIRANISINNLTPTKTDKVQIKYTNNNEAQEAKEIEIKYIAPTGLVPINTISNYAQDKQIRSIAGSQQQGIIEVSAPARTATSEIQLINNYTNKINNISILGRTLTTKTTKTESNENLENTFDAVMLNKITSSQMSEGQYTVYYSENGEATKDLNLQSNGWMAEPTNLSNVKSYLIVLQNYEMNTGDSIKFSYEMQIPEGLNYNEKVNSVYTVYFDNVQESQTINDKVVALGASLTTGEAPKLETSITSYTSENSVVRKGQYVKFRATVKNTGSMDAENVTLNITAPSANIYYYEENGKINFTENLDGKEGKLVATYKTKHTQFVEDDYISEYEDQDETSKIIQIGSLKAGEEKQVEYELKIDEVNIDKKSLPMQSGKLVEPELTMKTSASVMANKMTKAISSNEYSLKLAQGTMQVMVTSDKASDYTLTKGSKLTYTTRIEEISSGEDLKQLEITVKVPEGLKITNTSTKNRVISSQDKKVDIQTNGNTVTFKVDQYNNEDSIDFIVETQVESAQETINPVVTAKAQNVEEHTSNIVSNKVQTLNFSIEQQKLDQEYFKEGQEITYTYKIKNNSDVYTDSFIFENEIPEGTTFENAEIITATGTEKITSIDSNKLQITRTSFGKSEELTIKLTVVANKITSGEKEKQIQNYAVIYGDLFEKIESNKITSIIEYNKNAQDNSNGEDQEDDNKDNNDNNNVEGRYKISGTAWIDSNKNGQRDEDEEIIKGLKVRLYNQENNELVKDITTTSDSGKYTFENIPEGKYVVVFEYDNSKYILTQYQKEDVSKIVNSDVISMEMNIDGTNKIVAVSDTIQIKDSNARNIDVGMYVAPKSDLSLEKYISKVTLTYGDTTKVNEYNNAKIAKVEVPGKQLSKATVIVEYKIVVKNEGDVANYVKKIVDYIPQDMKFSAELNKDWYQSSNKDLYNASLANVELQPGESKEVTLTLTKKIAEDGTGIVNNNAEIYETYNKEGIKDIDSTEANKVSNEDDMSSADLVISIKTGEIVGIVGFISALICIAIIAIGYVSYNKMKKITYPRRRG